MVHNNYFESPSNIAYRNFSLTSVFLAGSIEQGKAEDWQSKITGTLIMKGFTVFNPRRKDWDSSWKQDYVDPQMNQQIGWEDNALNQADYIIIYLQPGTMSPISLYEFGKFIHSGKILMVCPEGFWRKANVDYECAKYNVPQFDSVEAAVSYLSDIRHKK
jgi:hypothetical protein